MTIIRCFKIRTLYTPQIYCLTAVDCDVFVLIVLIYYKFSLFALFIGAARNIPTILLSFLRKPVCHPIWRTEIRPSLDDSCETPWPKQGSEK